MAPILIGAFERGGWVWEVAIGIVKIIVMNMEHIDKGILLIFLLLSF
jgi:hypothetical protein